MTGSKVGKQRVRRRRLPLSEKRRIVELTLGKGASIRAIAREQGVNRNSLYQWQALYRAGKLTVEGAPRAHVKAASATFLPVTIAPAPRALQPVSGGRSSGVSIVQLTLGSGATLRIEAGALDAGFVCALIAELRR
jgi:transposase-like protein